MFSILGPRCLFAYESLQQPLSTTVQSLTKIHTRAARAPSPQPAATRYNNPLFSFALLPTSTSLRSRTFDPRKPSSPSTPSFVTARRQITAFQDIMLTVPTAGRLELHRGTIIPPVKPIDTPTTAAAASGGSSSSTPPRASPGKTSISLPTSGLTHMMQAVRGTSVPGMRVHMAPLATWDVKKDREWEDVKGVFNHEPATGPRAYDQE